MDRLEILKQVSFGLQVAEDEVDELSGYFVETDQWGRIAKGNIDIVRGEKGSGKSAIYSLLMKRAGEFFDKGVLLVAAENPRGATVFRDLVSEPPTSEQEFIALWKLYILALSAQQMREYDVRGKNAEKVYHFLEEAELLEKEFSLKRMLKAVHDYAKRIINAEAYEGGITLDPATQMPNGVTGKIVLREPTADIRRRGIVTVDDLLEDVDKALQETNLHIWVLLDRLDVAFVESHDLEANALRALVRAYADLKNRDRISLKIFLREDIWIRISEGGLREASHLVKYVMLDWNEASLMNLIMRRVLKNEAILKAYDIQADEVMKSQDLQQETFYRLFPKQVEQGPQKAATFKWLLTRCADGTRKTAPREVIHLLNSILEKEIKRLEQGGVANDAQLFDRSVFKQALPAVSGARLHQNLYAEYPKQKPYIAKLESQKAEQTLESLKDIWSVPSGEARHIAEKLVELGFFEERGTRDSRTYWVPFLYRDALNLVQGRADADE